MDAVDRIALPSDSPAQSAAAVRPNLVWRRIDTALTILCIALLAAIMGLAARRLFTGMTTVGMTGVDTFDYWRVANELLHGHYASDSDRLSFYALSALALKLLGANDYAIRSMSSGFAVLNIALVYLLAQRVARNAALALAAAALYAFNPVVMYYAGTELPHITGATFVLVCALMALPATNSAADVRTRMAAGFLMGLSLTAAALTHEELAFLGPGYLLVIALPLTLPAEPTEPLAKRRREVAFTAGALVIGGAAAAACLMAGFGLTPWKMLHDALVSRDEYDANTAIRTGGQFFATVPLRILHNFTVDLMGQAATALAVVIAVVAPVAFAVRRSERLKRLLTVEIPVVVYVAAFLGIAQIYLEGNYQRLFVPLLGPTIVFALCGAYLLLPKLRWAAAAAVIAWVAYGVVGDRPWNFSPPAVSPYRQLYDAVKDRVTPQSKLLLPACYPIAASWVGIGSSVYLDGNIVPIYLLPDFVSLDALIAANHVGYVYLPSTPESGTWPRERVEQLFRDTYGERMDPAVLEALPRVSQQIWRGDTRVEWSKAACAYEKQVLRRLLEERGARLALTVPSVGDFYEMRR